VRFSNYIFLESRTCCTELGLNCRVDDVDHPQKGRDQSITFYVIAHHHGTHPRLDCQAFLWYRRLYALCECSRVNGMRRTRNATARLRIISKPHRPRDVRTGVQRRLSVSYLHMGSINLIISRTERHVDSAQLYQNEEGVGQAVREVIETGRLRREDLFISEFLLFRDTENDEA
jgi:hypothetical protein